MASGFRLIELETLTTDDEILPGGFSSSLDPGDPAPPTRHSSILWPYRLFYLFVCTSGICSTSGPDISSIFRLEFLLEWKSVITFFFFYKLHFIVYDNKIFKYFSYHNVDIYLFPIFLVTNKKKNIRRNKFKYKENQQLRYQTSIKFISRRLMFLSRPLQRHFTFRQLIKRRRAYSRNIRCDVATHRTSPPPPSPFVLRPPWAICVLYRRCFPPGEKAGGTLYSWRRNGSLRRMKQRRIIYAPCGRVHKAQIF